MYQCINCRKDVKLDLATTRKIICPYCGYRIVEKLRAKTINKVQAR